MGNIIINLLKIAYNKAVKDNKDTFIFNGREFVTKYAKYLIEYAEDKPRKEI